MCYGNPDARGRTRMRNPETPRSELAGMTASTQHSTSATVQTFASVR